VTGIAAETVTRIATRIATEIVTAAVVTIDIAIETAIRFTMLPAMTLTLRSTTSEITEDTGRA
jgi:hypothetical protein